MMPRLGIQYTATGEKATIQTAFSNIAAGTTDGTFTRSAGGTLAAVPDKCIVVLAIFAHLQGGAACDITLNSKGSGAGTAISATKQVVPNGGWVQSRGCATDYLYKTKNGETLTATVSGDDVGIDIVYTLSDS